MRRADLFSEFATGESSEGRPFFIAFLTMERLKQPVATHGNGFGLFEPFLSTADLRPVAIGLDWLLIAGRSHLEHVLRTYTAHYNAERPHRALALVPPQAGNTAARPANAKVERHDLLGGLIHEYRAAA